MPSPPPTSMGFPDFPRFATTARRARGISLSEVAAVLCIGDSYLAGWNAAGYRTMQFTWADVEFRGASFGCGDGRLWGQKPIETLATLLKRSRPSLKGMSTGWTPKYGSLPSYPKQCGFNAAASGATVSYLYGQAAELVKHVNSTPLANEWKVVTVQAGWGELAWDTGADARIFANWIYGLLLLLKMGLGKTYVNLLAVSERGDSFAVNQRGSTCSTKFGLWKSWQKMMHNATFKTDSSVQESVRLNAVLEAAPSFFDSEDFVVRFQPMFRHYVATRYNTDPVSCFHPSMDGHEALGWALFQNMLAPQLGVNKIREPSLLVGARNRTFLRKITDGRKLQLF